MHRPWRILFVGTDPELEHLGDVASRLPVEVTLAPADAVPVDFSIASPVPPDVIVLALADADAIAGDIVTRLTSRFPISASRVVVLAHQPSVSQTVDVMRAGAFALLEQPVADDVLLATLRQVCEHGVEARGGESSAVRIIGRSRGICDVLDIVRTVAPSDANCLIVGENGTGKELVAEAIHASSARAGGPFVKVNCAAIPSELLESELFGHVRGAFTDAIADRQGLFERANGGSLLLDEVGEMPSFMQAKLLRVLQERQFRPIGASHTVTLDARLICATNVDIAKAVKARELREDLLFRINTITLRVPPLRERIDDLSLLTTHFLQEFARRYERPVPRVSPSAMDVMTHYPWPGNVRELEHILERAVLLTPGDTIGAEALPAELRNPKPAAATGPPLMKLDEIERLALVAALERANWNKQVAAAALGIYRPTLYSKMRKYAIQDRRRG